MSCNTILFPILLIASLPCPAQLHESAQGNLRVRVVYTNDRAVTTHARVQLMNSASNNSVAEEYTNDRGEAEFYAIDAGDYHVVVTGDGIEETDSGIFEVDSRKGSQSIFVTVKRTGEDTPEKKPGPAISVNQLKIPEVARAKFSQGAQLLSKQDWADAASAMNQAIALYPSYAEAYNSLAVAQSHLGQRKEAKESLEKATHADAHFVLAFVNLAHLDEGEQRFSDAEAELTRAAEINSSPELLTLLCRDQLLAGHYDAAIATAGNVHAIPNHEKYAVVHYIAARAYQHESRNAEAMAEFKLLLKEEPTGDRANAVRKEVERLEGRR